MPHMPIIDTHLHLIDQSVLSYPWLSGIEALNRNFLYEKYALQAHRVGITHALHMEVDVAPTDIQAETDYIVGLAKRGGSIIAGAISSCRPEEHGFRVFLERQQINPLVKGFRRVLHVMPDDLSESALFRENIKSLAARAYVRPVCLAEANRQGDRARRSCAGCAIHPRPLRRSGHQGRRASTSGAARSAILPKRPNVTAKISGVVAYADAETWRVETLAPYVTHVIDIVRLG